MPIEEPSSSLVESQGVEGGRREEEIEEVEERLQGVREPRPAEVKVMEEEKSSRLRRKEEEMREARRRRGSVEEGEGEVERQVAEMLRATSSLSRPPSQAEARPASQGSRPGSALPRKVGSRARAEHLWFSPTILNK